MAITRKRLNVLLWLLATLVVAAGVAVLAAAWVWPMDLPAPPPPAMTYAAAPVADRPPPLPSLADLQRLGQITLYRPVQEPTVAAAPAAATLPAPAPPPPPQLNVQLVGTVMEADNSRAFFQLPSGRTVLRRVGQSVAGARIVSIERQSAVLEYQGQTLTLQAPRRGAGGRP